MAERSSEENLARAVVSNAISHVGHAHGSPVPLGPVALYAYDKLSEEPPPPTPREKLKNAAESIADNAGKIVEGAMVVGVLGAAAVEGFRDTSERGPLPIAKMPPRKRKK